MLATIRQPAELRGSVEVPGDKSISHRALILNAVAAGPARIQNLATGEDVASTARCLRALGCAGDAEGEPEPVAAAIAGLSAREAEDMVTGAGGIAAAVRDEASRRAEPPGQAVAAAPLVEAASVGGAPPRWRPAGALPASGIRVLDLTRVIAGPVATRYLGALGADVLRLDPPDRPELTLHALDGLFAKRSALLDFGTAGGRARLDDLLAGADVLVHGYRPHALDRFGLGPQALAERHPGLVVVSLSAWGSRGP